MSKISICQEHLITLLRADAFFQDNTDPMHPIVKVPIVSKKLGDVASKFEEQLTATRLGLVVILRRAKRIEVQLGSRALECQFGLLAVVNPTLNAALNLPLAYEIVEAAFNVLEGQFNGVNPNDQTETSRFSPDTTAIVSSSDPRRPHLDIVLLNINTIIDISP